MKVCPVCKSGAFDDAQVCYGCMHKFTKADVVQQKKEGAIHSEGVSNNTAADQSTAKCPSASIDGCESVCELNKGASVKGSLDVSEPEKKECGSERDQHIEKHNNTELRRIRSKCSNRRRGAPVRSISLPADDAEIVVRIQVLGGNTGNYAQHASSPDNASAVAL